MHHEHPATELQVEADGRSAPGPRVAQELRRRRRGEGWGEPGGTGGALRAGNEHLLRSAWQRIVHQVQVLQRAVGLDSVAEGGAGCAQVWGGVVGTAWVLLGGPMS